MKYRPEIDGLRTVAVLPVILFHAGFGLFSGGYVGVDIFFVISGYLITTILIDDLAQGRFSILRFYERRARRILPALFTVLAVCVPAAWFWMLPSQYKDFSQSLVAVVLFASNFLFWRESGYFDTSSEEKPLLHTWSLAVEEQYYLLFPLFLFLIWRFGRRPALHGIVLLGLLSLGASEWGWRNAPNANFYLAPFRAWELFIGSACAFVMASARAPRPNAGFAWLGLGLIALSILVYDNATPFPSLYALAPTLGTALIVIFAAPPNPVGRLLSLRPMVAIGLISYSACLWHQPLFAFARLRHVAEPPDWLMAALALLSLGLAWLSWRFIERPFRGKAPFPSSRKAVFGMAIMGSAIFAAIGIDGHRRNGLNANADYAVPFLGDGGACYFTSVNGLSRLPDCRDSLGEKPRVVLIGDSHAQALSKILRKALSDKGVDLITFATARCLPVPEVVENDAHNRDECSTFMRAAFATLPDIAPDAILLHGRWAHYLSGTRYSNARGISESGDTAHVRAIGDDSPPEEAREKLPTHIAKELTALSAIAPVIVIGQIPETGWWPPHVAMLGRSDLLNEPYDAYLTRNGADIAFFQKLAQSSERLHYFGPDTALCPDTLPRKCDEQREGELLYYDSNHLSHAGARIVVDDLMHWLPGWMAHPAGPRPVSP